MPIDVTKLWLLPANFQQSMFDTNTTELAIGGKIKFFKTDRVTPKSVYYWSGDPQNPFLAVNEIDLTQGVVPNNRYPLWLYPYDEADNKTAQLYYISVENSAEVSIWSLDQYPQHGVPTPDENDESLANLCPTYGFDVPVWQDFYASDNNVTEVINAPAWGWLWHKDKPNNAYFTYQFERLAVGTVDGDPDYEITLKAANVTAAQTVHWFSFPLGFAYELAGKDITFEIYARDKSTAAVTQLKAVLIREKNKVVQPPTEVATINLSSSRDKKTIAFTVPTLPAGTFVSQDKMYLGFELPFNQDFQVAFTGSFCYEGKDKTYTVLKTALPERFARLRNALPLQFSKTEDWEFSYLAKTDGIGRTDVQNATGSLFLGPHGKDFNFAVPLHGQVLIRGDKLNNTLADRFLDNAHAISDLSPNAFKVTKDSNNACTVTTYIEGKFHSAWESQSGSVTISDPTPPTPSHGISSTIDGTNNRLLHITFDDNFAPDQGPTQYKTSAGQCLTNYPSNNAIVSWFGDFVSFGSGVSYPFAFSAYSQIIVTTTDPGSDSTQATVDIEFGASGLPVSDLTPTNNTYKAADETFPIKIPKNYFEYMSKDISPSPNGMPNPPPFAIAFIVDKKGAHIPSQKLTIPVAITTAEAGDGSILASKMNDSINTAESKKLTFTGVPANGDYLKISTLNTDLVLIFYHTNQTKPTNPLPARKAIYAEFDGGATVEQALDATIKSLRTDVGGIPTYDALKLSHYENLTNYIEV